VTGCGGHFEGVEVEHAAGLTNWHDRDEKKRCSFRLGELMRAVLRARELGRLQLADGHALECVPAGNAEFFAA